MQAAPTAREAIEGLLMATADAAGQRDRPKGCLLVLSGAHPDALPDGVCGELAAIRKDSMATMEARLQASGPCTGLPPAAAAATHPLHDSRPQIKSVLQELISIPAEASDACDQAAQVLQTHLESVETIM